MKFGKKIIIPLLLLIICTVILDVVDADIRLSSFFYDPQKGGWFLSAKNPWNFLYEHGRKPAFLMAIAALVVFVAGWFRQSMVKFRQESLFILLFLAIGPGLVVDSGFKDLWGRPRPNEIINFGGEFSYLPPWQKGAAGKNSSFPSGHATMGFYLIAPYFFLRQRKNRLLALCVLGGGLFAGSFIGAARIVQGKHFLSDVIWAGGMIYLTGEILAGLFHFNGYGEDESTEHL